MPELLWTMITVQCLPSSHAASWRWEPASRPGLPMTITFVAGVHFAMASLMSEAWTTCACCCWAPSCAIIVVAGALGRTTEYWATAGPATDIERVTAIIAMTVAFCSARQARLGAASLDAGAREAATAKGSGTRSPRAANSAATALSEAEALAEPAASADMVLTAASRRAISDAPRALTASARTSGVTGAAMRART